MLIKKTSKIQLIFIYFKKFINYIMNLLIIVLFINSLIKIYIQV